MTQIDWRYAPPNPVPLAIQHGLPGFEVILTVVYSAPPPVYECVCGAESATPLPRCWACEAVMCSECRSKTDPSTCDLCYDIEREAGTYQSPRQRGRQR